MRTLPLKEDSAPLDNIFGADRLHDGLPSRVKRLDAIMVHSKILHLRTANKLPLGVKQNSNPNKIILLGKLLFLKVIKIINIFGVPKRE